MRRTTTTLLVLTAVALVAPAALPARAEVDGSVDFLIGKKLLDDNDWEPNDDQTEFGVLLTIGKKGWPLHLAFDLISSSEDTKIVDPAVATIPFEIAGRTEELDIGVRKVWHLGQTRAFLGGGVALVNGTYEIAGIDYDDDALGAWIDGGVFWRLGRHFNIGFEARLSRAEIDVVLPFPETRAFEPEAGGEHFGMILGWAW